VKTEVRSQKSEENRFLPIFMDAVTVSGPGGGDDHAPFARFRHGMFMGGGGTSALDMDREHL